MKILVVSDSHGEYGALRELALKYSDVDYFFHLGDYEIPTNLLSPFTFVKGNCDFLSDGPKERDVVINNIKFHLEHGDNFLYYKNFNDYIKSKECDVFLFGHTHKRFNKYIDNTLVLNPGSLTRPRDEFGPSYLIIEIFDNNKISYKFKSY